MQRLSTKKLALLVGKLTLLGLLLAVVVWRLVSTPEFTKLLERFKTPSEIGWHLIVAGWACFFCATSINIVRWRLLTLTLGLKLSLRDAFRIGLISNFVSQLPVGVGMVGGDTVRAVFLTRTNPKHGAEATTAVVMDRACGLMALLLLGGIGSLFLDMAQIEQAQRVAVEQAQAAGSQPKPTYLVDIVWVVRGLAVATLVGGVISLIPGLTKSKLWDVVTHIPYAGRVLQRLVNAVRVYHSRLDRIFIAVLMSLVVQSLFVLSLHCVTEGLHLPHPDLKTHFSIGPISFVGAALPIGAFEVLLEAMYSAIGLEAGSGLLAAIGYRVGTVVTALVGLMIYLATRAESAAVLHDVEVQQHKAERLG